MEEATEKQSFALQAGSRTAQCSLGPGCAWWVPGELRELWPECCVFYEVCYWSCHGCTDTLFLSIHCYPTGLQRFSISAHLTAVWSLQHYNQCKISNWGGGTEGRNHCSTWRPARIYWQQIIDQCKDFSTLTHSKVMLSALLACFWLWDLFPGR